MFLLLLTICIISVKSDRIASYEGVSPNYYCADMNPQQHINIEQLMGMWYGIEIIPHEEDEAHYSRIDPSCPIIHLSEEKPTANYKPTPNPTQSRRYGPISHTNASMKQLRLMWDENGAGTEYHLVCNVSRPGFWTSSGPQNGSHQLVEKFGHFAGAVQVIKAVGSHLVLTFCHQLPDRQLFSVILARETKLDGGDVHGVHSLLNRRGLSTNAIRKVCYNGVGRLMGGGAVGFWLIVAFVLRF